MLRGKRNRFYGPSNASIIVGLIKMPQESSNIWMAARKGMNGWICFDEEGKLNFVALHMHQ